MAWSHFTAKRWDLAAEEFRLFARDWPHHPKSAEAEFYLAESLLQQGAFSEARNVYKRLLEAHQLPATAASVPADSKPRLPPSLIRHVYFRAAETTFLAGKSSPTALDEAAKWFHHFCQSWPDDPLAARAWNYLGQICLQHGNYEEAAELLRRSLDRRPDDALSDAARFRLAECLEKLGQEGEAERFYFALMHKNTSPLAIFAGWRLARMLHEAGRSAEEADVYEHLLRTWPEHSLAPRCRLALGRVRLRLGQTREAVEILNPLVAHPTLEAEAKYWLAVAQLDQGNPAAALNTLESLPRLEENDLLRSWAELRKAECYLRLGQPYQAQMTLTRLAESAHAKTLSRRTAENEAEVVEFYDHLARLHVASFLTAGQVNIAGQVARQYVARSDQASVETKFVLAQALLACGDWPGAKELLRDLENKSPDEHLAIQVRMALAEVCVAEGNLSLATSLLRHVLENSSGPQRLKAALHLAQVERKAGNKLSARSILENLCNERHLAAEAQVYAEVLYELTTLALEEDEIELAKGYGERLQELPLAPADKAALLRRLAVDAMRKQHFAWAKEILLKASNATNDVNVNASTALNIALCDLHLGNPTEAIPRVEQAVRLVDETSPLWSELWFVLAQAADLTGNKEQALTAYQQAFRSAEPRLSEQATWAAAQICEQVGYFDLASMFYESLYQRHPTQLPLDEVLFRWAVAVSTTEPDRKVTLLTKLVQQFPHSPRAVDAYLELAQEAIRTQDFGSANKYVEAVLTSQLQSDDKRLTVAKYLAALAAIGGKEWTKAEALLKEVISQEGFELRAQAFFGLGEALYQQGRVSEAAEAFRAALQVAEARPGESSAAWLSQAEIRLIEAALQHEDLATARERATNFLKKYPHAPEVPLAVFALGKIAYREGRLAEAQAHLASAVEMAVARGLSIGAEAQLLLAESYYLADDYRSALREYLRLEILFPKSPFVPAAVLQAAKCYEYLGLVDEAKRQLRRVLELWPESPYAVKAKERLENPKLIGSENTRISSTK
ncbi:MAG: tetratricopeptide repeat protein [Thermoguttaceae bacterium]|nr:tetratricopeptide repeat protein [Thermoguttaceae bacterium]